VRDVTPASSWRAELETVPAFSSVSRQASTNHGFMVTSRTLKMAWRNCD